MAYSKVTWLPTDSSPKRWVNIRALWLFLHWQDQKFKLTLCCQQTQWRQILKLTTFFNTGLYSSMTDNQPLLRSRRGAVWDARWTSSNSDCFTRTHTWLTVNRFGSESREAECAISKQEHYVTAHKHRVASKSCVSAHSVWCEWWTQCYCNDISAAKIKSMLLSASVWDR